MSVRTLIQAFYDTSVVHIVSNMNQSLDRWIWYWYNWNSESYV